MQRAVDALGTRLVSVRRWSELRTQLAGNSRFLLFTLFGAYFVDNILLTVVVPILPRYLLLADRHECDTDSVRFNATLCELPAPFISEDIVKESNRVGALISSKAFVQLVANPLVGILTKKYGYRAPMHVGLYVLLGSTLLFAVGSSYHLLFLARSLHGIGSSCVCIAGMGIVAASFDDEKERSSAMGEVLGGMALGVLFGYPLGGILYDFSGKATPFVLIASIITVLIVLQSLAFGTIFAASNDYDDDYDTQPSQFGGGPETGGANTFRPPSPFSAIINLPQPAAVAAAVSVVLDPYILAAALIICTTTTAMAVLEPCLPIWLMDTMNPPEWQIGTVFIPDSVGYFIGCNYFSVFAYKKGRWKCATICVLSIALCSFLIPFAKAVWQLMIPHFGLGLALGITDASLMPLLAHLVDQRHHCRVDNNYLNRRQESINAASERASYGSVFAVGQTAVCLAYSLGLVTYQCAIATHAGFAVLMRYVALLNLCTIPACLFLRTNATACAQKPLSGRESKVTKLSSQNLPSSHSTQPFAKNEETPIADTNMTSRSSENLTNNNYYSNYTDFGDKNNSASNNYFRLLH